MPDELRRLRRQREANTSWSARRTKDGWEGTVKVMVGSLPMRVGAEGVNARQALARAAIAMRAIAESPVARAALPPGTAAAIEAIHALATSRNIHRTLRKYGGAGARRLARALGF